MFACCPWPVYLLVALLSENNQRGPVAIAAVQSGVPSLNMQIERNLGIQPIAALLEEHALRHHDLVATSPAEITHKMVARACKGRRLTSNVKVKVRDAINVATGRDYTIADLFNY